MSKHDDNISKSAFIKYFSRTFFINAGLQIIALFQFGIFRLQNYTPLFDFG